jgi:hypothetical protein
VVNNQIEYNRAKKNYITQNTILGDSKISLEKNR